MPNTQKPHAPGVAAQPEEQADCSAPTARSVVTSAADPAEAAASEPAPVALAGGAAASARRAAASAAASGDLSKAETPQSILPEVSLEHTDPGEDTRTRRGIIESKRRLESQRALAFIESRGMQASAEKNALYKEIRDCAGEAARLERHLNENFVPIHGPEQFLSPRAFFVSPLFGVRSRNEPRQKHIELQLPVAHGKPAIGYAGPELRQCDGLVFLALVHMLRDVQAGTAVSLKPQAVCQALFGRYDGNARRQLREHIQRLQQGLLIFETFSVQLCQRFDYPKSGRWTVGLDKHITRLFAISPRVWFALEDRLALPEGLATWLYTFVASQTRLIPMKLAMLKDLCGSEATDKAFSNRMRDAMKHLARCGVIDTGWSVGHGEVRWLKLSNS